MSVVDKQGKVLITGQGLPEAVILHIDEYMTLTNLARKAQYLQAQQLAELSARFDQRLASLNRPDASDVVNSFMSEALGRGVHAQNHDGK